MLNHTNDNLPIKKGSINRPPFTLFFNSAKKSSAKIGI